MLAASLSATSWSSTQWDKSPNSQVFAANCVLTCDGFRNAMHTDLDKSLYSLGCWGILEEKTGRLITSQERMKLLKLNEEPGFHCNALGAKFQVGPVIVELDSADVVTMVFNTQIDHQTTHPTIKPPGSGFGGNFTRCAISSQISRTVASALRKISSCQGDMSKEEWEVVRESFGKSYGNEANKLKEKLS